MRLLPVHALLALAAALALAPAAAATAYPLPTGETVEIDRSPSYQPDPARDQQWATFLGSLAHGSEISGLTLYLAPLDEVRSACGPRALACYSPNRQRIVAPGDDNLHGPAVESVVAHEYGHHVAASRLNPPWNASAWGTKRWATYAGVCAKADSGAVFPGDEGEHYALNPGEAFAESYRLLNERLAGKPDIPWGVVDPSFIPDDTALELVRQDVVDPWAGPTRYTVANALRPGKGRYRFTVPTPLDGEVELTLRPPAGARFDLWLYDPATHDLLARGTAQDSSTVTAGATACGQRSLLAVVTRARGSGAFTVEVSGP